MAVHAGNWPGWYKGMKPSLRPWRTHIQKRGFVCSLSICHFPREKTIQTDLKKRILPYASAPCVPLIEGLTQPLLIDVDVIILCDNTCTVSRQAMKLKGGHCSVASMLDGQRWEVLFEDLLLDRQDLCNCWVNVKKKKKWLQLSWSLFTSGILLLWLIKTAQLEIISLTWQWIKAGNLTFFYE